MLLKEMEDQTNFNAQSKLENVEGGWGYVITASIILIDCVTLVPMGAFGILYGPFLASIGDETTGVSFTLGAFATTSAFTGFGASVLLQKYSYRTVGLIGITIFSFGTFAEILSTTFYMFVCCSILKGIGYGILDPTSFAILNSYFDKKHSLMMGILQASIAIGLIFCPLAIAFLYENYGFRKTLSMQAGITLLGFLAVATFLPRKTSEISEVPVQVGRAELELQKYPLIETNTNDVKRNTIVNKNVEIVMQSEERVINAIESTNQRWLLYTAGLRLYLKPKYLNMALGLAVTWACESIFSSLLRVNLNNLNYSTYDVAKMSMVFFASDLVAKMCYSVVSGFCKISNRYLFFVSMLLVSLGRIVFTFHDGYAWKMVTLAMLGFLGAMVYTSLALVVSEQYKNNFSTTYCLYKLLAGAIFLMCGGVASYVKTLTQNDDTVIYVLSFFNLIFFFSWALELFYEWKGKQTVRRNQKI